MPSLADVVLQGNLKNAKGKFVTSVAPMPSRTSTISKARAMRPRRSATR
jgi:hypothetical protein